MKYTGKTAKEEKSPRLEGRSTPASLFGNIRRKKKNCHLSKRQTIFSQGDLSGSVFYLQIRLGENCGDFFFRKGSRRRASAPRRFFRRGMYRRSAFASGDRHRHGAFSVLEIEKREMIRVIHEEHEFSDRFVAHMLKRNVRVEEDLVDQLFNSSEKRLARALLLIARYGNERKPRKSSLAFLRGPWRK